MAREQLPVTPSVLQWARKRAGFSLDELERDFSNVRQWEAGEGGPTYSQLENLADKLKVPLAVFFFPHEPTTPPIEETFRTLPDTAIDELPSRMRLLLRKAKALQLNLDELCNGRNPAERLVTRELQLDPNGNTSALARQVREFLGVTLEAQIAWADDEAVLKGWRNSVEAVGVSVFKDAFRSPDFFGFCLTHEEFPLIYVNNTSAKTRQAFTIMHELGHLLFNTSGVDTYRELGTRSAQARLIEVACNALAAEILLPLAAFNEARLGLDASEASAERIAARFHVSRELVFRRFLDRGEISARQYEAAAERWRADARGGSGGDYYNNVMAYLGRRYISLALRAYYANRISERQLADYLGTKPKNLSSLESRFMSGAAA